MTATLQYLEGAKGLGEAGLGYLLSYYAAAKGMAPQSLQGSITGVEGFVQPYVDIVASHTPAVLAAADGTVDRAVKTATTLKATADGTLKAVYDKADGTLQYAKSTADGTLKLAADAAKAAPGYALSTYEKAEAEALALLLAPETAHWVKGQREEKLAQALSLLAVLKARSVAESEKAVNGVKSTTKAIEDQVAAVKATSEAYVSKVAEAARALKAEDLRGLPAAALAQFRGAADAVLAAVDAARKGDYAHGLVARVQDGWKALVSLPSVSAAVAEVSPKLESGVELAKRQYLAAHGALVSQPLYAQAVALALSRAAGLSSGLSQNAYVQSLLAFATSASERLYPTVEPFVGPYRAQAEALLASTLEHFKPVTPPATDAAGAAAAAPGAGGAAPVFVTQSPVAAIAVGGDRPAAAAEGGDAPADSNAGGKKGKQKKGK